MLVLGDPVLVGVLYLQRSMSRHIKKQTHEIIVDKLLGCSCWVLLGQWHHDAETEVHNRKGSRIMFSQEQKEIFTELALD